MWRKLQNTLAALLPGAPRAKPSSGSWGEDRAADALRRAGYIIIAQRVRVGRRDELDIIARRRDVLVFVEVKTRKNEQFGRPAQAVAGWKRRCLSRAAARYLKRMHPPPEFFRFDVVEVIGTPDAGTPPVIRHIENAFPMDQRYRIP